MVRGRGVGTSSPAASDRATSAASFLPARPLLVIDVPFSRLPLLSLNKERIVCVLVLCAVVSLHDGCCLCWKRSLARGTCGLRADDADVGVQPLRGDGDPGDHAAAGHRHHDGVQAAESSLFRLQTASLVRPLPGHWCTMPIRHGNDQFTASTKH